MMIKPTFLFLFFLCYLHLNGQMADPMVFGKVENVYSEVLNEERTIWVHHPSGQYDSLENQSHLPVVYVLDGDGHFHAITGMLQHLHSNSLCPKMIVVGITNTNRVRDLTPSKAEPGGYIDSSFTSESGGGEAFMKFIAEELKPYIETKFKAAPFSIFIGHSLGGLTVMNAFLNHTDLFNAYIAIDPSMWWDNRKLLGEIMNSSLEEKVKGRFLYLGIANTLENPALDTASVQKDTTLETEHIRSIISLDKYFHQKNNSNWNYSSKFYPEDDHGSVPFITEYDAFRFIFREHRLEITFRDFTDPASDLYGKIEKHYAQLSKDMGYEQMPDERMINSIGYEFLNLKNYEQAGKFFHLNVKNYPGSFNVYDSLGDYFLAIDDKENAKRVFEKSIAILPSSPSKKKLELLQPEKE